MPSIFISGILGFLGSSAAAAFQRAGWTVEGCDKRIYTPCEAGNLSKANVFLHCAANIESLDKRCKGTLEQFDDISLDRYVLDWLWDNPPQRLIWMSSCVSDLEDPNDPYSAVKRIGRSMALHFGRTRGVPVHILEPFSGYGEMQIDSYPFAAIGLRAIRRENPLIVWSNSIRDFVHVNDIVRHILAAAAGQLPAGESIQIGTGLGTTFTELANMFAAEVGYKPTIMVDRSKPAGHPYRVMEKSPWLSPTVTLEQGVHQFVEAHHND